MVGKKCMGRQVMELALFLSLLYVSNDFLGGQDDWIQDDRPRDPDDFELFNDTGYEGGVVGSTYSHTQRPSGYELTRHLWSKELEGPRLDDWSISTLDESTYYRGRILEELRRINLNRYSQLPRHLGDQQVTAYLLEGTSTPEPEGVGTSLLEEMELISTSMSLDPVSKDTLPDSLVQTTVEDIDYLQELNALFTESVAASGTDVRFFNMDVNNT